MKVHIDATFDAKDKEELATKVGRAYRMVEACYDGEATKPEGKQSVNIGLDNASLEKDPTDEELGMLRGEGPLFLEIPLKLTLPEPEKPYIDIFSAKPSAPGAQQFDKGYGPLGSL